MAVRPVHPIRRRHRQPPGLNEERTISVDDPAVTDHVPNGAESTAQAPVAASEPDTQGAAAQVVSGQGAPPVVAIVVARDPGDWFPDAVASLEAQDYPQLSILVVDNGGEQDPAERVVDVAPFAFVKRRSSDEGFSAAANEAAASIEGAPFLLFCHDDVSLEPDAVTQMVADAFRSNAGIVGPKIRDWDDRAQLRSVGLSVDRYGAARELVDDGELDQSQHDISRGVFAVSDACMLVRADLFNTIGGFSEAIGYFGEDVDLCWKAHLAGASVQYCHRAVAYHRGDFASRRIVDAKDRMELRNQARMTLTGHDAASLWRIVPAAAIASIAELVVSVVVGRGRIAVDIVATYLWVLTHPIEILRERRRREPFRRTSEADWSTMQRRGSNRMRKLGLETSEDNRLLDATRAGRDRIRSATKDISDSRAAVVLAVLIPLVLALGARGLWFGVLPSMREFTTLGDSTGALLSEWWTGWRSAGIGEPSLPPAGVPGLGVLGTILWLSAGAARRVLVLAPLILGPLGAWRLFARGTSFRARSAMVAVYGLSPIALNAMGEARLQAMVAYAAAPWVLRRISRRAGLVPFAPAHSRSLGSARGPRPARQHPPRLRDYAGTAVLVGVVAALSPLAALVTVVAVALMMIGPALSGSLAAAGSAWRHLAVAVLGAVALNLPWLVSAARGGDLASLTGLWVGRGPVPSAADMLTGSLGSLQAGLLGWGFVVAAAVPLFTGRSWRSGWAVGAWIAIAAGLLAAVLAGEADLLAGAGVEVLLVPVVLGLAVSSAMVPLAFEEDVVRADFGSRQIITFIGAAALFAAMVPPALAATQGRWYLPEGDFDRALTLVDGGDDFRAMWIGDPDVLPLGGWSLDSVPGVNIGFSQGLDPSMPLRWRLDGGGSVADASAALTAAMEGRTARMGRGVSPMAIRYVVVVDRPAPEPFAPTEVATPEGVVDALEEQLDLRRILVGPGIDLFEVSAPWPPRSDITEPPEPATAPSSVLGDGFGTRFSGELRDGAVIAQSVTADPGWHLEVDGTEATRENLFTWGQKFTVDDGGAAQLSWSPPLSTRALQIWQVLVLLTLVVFATRRDSLPTPHRRRRAMTVEQPLVVVEGPGESPDDWSEGFLGSHDQDSSDAEVDDEVPSEDSGSGDATGSDEGVRPDDETDSDDASRSGVGSGSDDGAGSDDEEPE